MNIITLSKDFFLGGNATFTVENPTGDYYTFKIRKAKGNARYNNQPYFVGLLSGPNNETDYTYLGMMDNLETGSIRLTAKSRMKDDSKPVKVVRWALLHSFGDGLIPEGYKIRHEGKCACCGRALTVPESLTRGIGPECWNKMGRA